MRAWRSFAANSASSRSRAIAESLIAPRMCPVFARTRDARLEPLPVVGVLERRSMSTPHAIRKIARHCSTVAVQSVLVGATEPPSRVMILYVVDAHATAVATTQPSRHSFFFDQVASLYEPGKNRSGDGGIGAGWLRRRTFTFRAFRTTRLISNFSACPVSSRQSRAPNDRTAADHHCHLAQCRLDDWHVGHDYRYAVSAGHDSEDRRRFGDGRRP